MDRPLSSSAEAEEELEWQVASRRRKAWAKCRSSWQASETEDLSTEATTQDEEEDEEEDLPGAQLPAAGGRGRCARPGSGGRLVGWGESRAPWAPATSSGRASGTVGRGERGHFRPSNARAGRGAPSVNTDNWVPSDFPAKGH